MVHDSRLPFGHSARNRLTQPVRALLTLTILTIAACDRPEQLSAPPLEPAAAPLIDDVAMAASAESGPSYSRIALRSMPTRCLDLAGSPSTVGVRTTIAACDATKPSQRFTVSQATRQIISIGGRCLSAGVSGHPIGSAIALAACMEAGRQLWTLDGATGRIRGPEGGCVTVRGASLQLGAAGFLGSCGAYASWAQRFTWTRVSGPIVTPPAPPPPGPPASLSVTPQSVSLAIGRTQQLNTVALDASGNPVSGVTFTYRLATSGTAASVSATGLVTAKAVGNATVRVASGALLANVGVTVTNTAPLPLPPPAPPPSGIRAIDPTLPLDSVLVRWPISSGQTWQVHAGDNLQAVLNQAQRGDQIVIDPGITFTGNFVLPGKPGTAASGWILVRSANLTGLPPAGARATPRFASAMPKLVTPNVNAALSTAYGASGWYIAGIEITLSPLPQWIHYGLVNLGDGGSGQNTLASVATDIVLDRVYIHGVATMSLKRCVGLNSARTAVVNSTLSQCAAKGLDSQAILGWNGPGPYRIENNYLEGAGENVMFGGGDPYIANLVPSDITIRRNHFSKPLSWRGRFTVKNLLETKNARRVLVENNIFENNWTDGQTGFAIVLKSANQGGAAPWSQTSDVTFRYNIVRHSSAAFAISANPRGNPAVPAARIKVEHNLVYEVGKFLGTTNGRMVQLMNRLSDVQVVNNTMVHNAIAGVFILLADAGPAQRLIIRDNVATWGGPWGAVMGLAPQGTPALAAYAPSSYTFERNVVSGLLVNLLFAYPASSFYAPTLANIGFMNPAAYDFRLSPSSAYTGRSTTNGNPGADVATIMARTANVIVP